MDSFAAPLAELRDRCAGKYSLTEDDRSLLHNAYWAGNDPQISVVLELLCFQPDPQDLPVLLDASSPGSLWVHRCDAAQALGGLGEEGARALRLMYLRDTHPTVRFYIFRELIDLEEEFCMTLLDGPIPPVSSPNKRSLWIYGNFERGENSVEQSLKYLSKLLQDRKRRHDWLRDHLSGVN